MLESGLGHQMRKQVDPKAFPIFNTLWRLGVRLEIFPSAHTACNSFDFSFYNSTMLILLFVASRFGEVHVSHLLFVDDTGFLRGLLGSHNLFIFIAYVV